MKKFNKTLLATALMIAAGSANATISVKDDASELFMSVYDTSSKNTYSYDTGITLSTLLANVNNTAYSFSKDLSTDTNWTTKFKNVAGFNTATTTYALVVASGINPNVLVTSSAVGGLPAADTDIAVDAIVSGTKDHAGFINSGIALVNGSKVVNDGGVAGTGQFTDFDTLFGNQNNGHIAAAYGSKVSFFNETYVPNAAGDANMAVVEKFAGQWQLAGNTLSYSVAAVPLPAAVWMFGAGLMGMLRLNRRKSMAV
jgi:hypothetical protein